MKDAINSHLAKEPFGRPDLRAMTQACTAAVGHFDELRGVAATAQQATHCGTVDSAGSALPLTPGWQQFFNSLAPQGEQELNQRWISLQRQIRDNGVTYNVYADEGGPQRPWSLDLFPC